MSSSTATIVGKLTAPATWRREFGARMPLLATLLLCLGIGIAEANGEWQPIEDIATAAEQFLEARIGKKASRTSIRAGMLDSRHRLALCSKPLEPFLRPGTRISPRTTVGVRCTGQKPWKVYVPVTVAVTDTVLVASRMLPRGHVISNDDLRAEDRDVSRLLSGYVTDKKTLIGQRLKSQLLAGRLLTPRMLEVDLAIHRGQSVTLIVKSGGIDVQMSGKALTDGTLSQRIKVKNTHSGRIVEGIVRSREHVEVLLAANNRFFHAKPKVSPNVADMRSSNNDR